MLRGEEEQGSGGGDSRPTAVASPCITGRIYQIIQITGLDGKNLLQLLPVSKPLGNTVSSVQSPAISDNSKRNVSVSGHGKLKDVFTNTTSFPFVKVPERKITTPGRLILPKPLDPMENMKSASAVKVKPTTQTVYSILSNYVTSVCPSKNKEYVLVNTKNLPVNIQPSVLPSGRYLKIPAQAEVESVPTTSLPPIIQQKILSVTRSNASGTSEIAGTPSVIYTSPVHTVKTAVPETLETVCPKTVAKVPNSLSPTVAVTTVAVTTESSSCLGVSNSKEKRTAPMKWVVQENPQSSASCLVPVKSSNFIASKVLKTMADMKNEKINPAKVLPACINTPGESQMQDNSLTKRNGKVYFLVQKKPTLSTEECSKQALPSAETHFRKNTLQLLNSAVNLVLSKNKQTTSKDLKSSDNSRLQLQSELDKNLKAASFVSPHQNLQIINTNQCEVPSVSQRSPTEINVAQKSITEGKATYAVLHKVISRTVGAVSTKQGVSEDEKQKTEKILRMAARTKDGEEQEKKHLELRKKFGLCKEERLCLKRICLSDIKRQEATRCSSAAQRSVSSKLVQTTVIKPEPEGEERLIEKQEELNIKRSRRTPTILENVKRRKIEESVLNSELEDSPSCSVMDGSSSPCRKVIPQQESSISFLHSSQGADSSSNRFVQSEERNTISSPSPCCEDEPPLNEGSFKEDTFPCIPPDLDDTIRDEKITKLKLLLKQREAALEEVRKQMQQT